MWAFALAVLAGVEFADPARKPLETCEVVAVSFRTANDGWLGDACGKIFRSSDGGGSWSRSPELERALLGTPGTDKSPTKHHVARFVWRTANAGLAFLDAEPFVWRTTDGGLTWAAAAGLWRSALAVDAVGAHVWICDSSGALTHSTDQGVTWTREKKLFEESAFPSDACAGISLLDDVRGWALGWKSLWETSDGGATWTQLALPSAREKFIAVTRLTNEVGWVRTKSGQRFVTIDGAKSWTEHPAAPSRAVALRSNGRAVLLATAARSSSDRELTLEANEDELDSREVISVALLERIRSLRQGPVLSPGSPTPNVRLEHTTDGPLLRWGASGPLVFRAKPKGEWYLAHELPAKVEQLLVLESGSVLARTKAGLFKDGRPTETSSDLQEFERLAAAGRVSATERSLDCLQKNQGWLQLDWVSAGCFHHRAAFVRVELEGRFARLQATNGRSDSMDELRTGKTLTSARALIGRFAAAATRPEVPTGCESTTGHQAKLRWRCGQEPERELAFSTRACAPRVQFVDGEVRAGEPESGYDRALGLIDVAQSLFAASR